MTHILSIHASANGENSVTNTLINEFLAAYTNEKTIEQHNIRNIADGLPTLSGAWAAANGTDAADRTDEQNETLALSDSLIAEIENNDLLLIAVPIYNFTIPATLKSWIDHICRARKTFQYSENGPEGLIKGKKVVLFAASGGTAVDSPIDFAVPYLRHVLSFIGITDVTVVAADAMAMDPETVTKAKAQAQETAKNLAAAA